MASQAEIDAVWNKGTRIPGEDANQYRRDARGNRIYKPAYGKQGPYSWEIDHAFPVSRGGPDALHNKQPLQTAENRKKGDKIT